MNLSAAFDQHAQWLTDTPDPTVDPDTCISRKIGLDGGHYIPQQFIRPEDNSGTVWVTATGTVFNNTTTQNTWTWRDCLNIGGRDYWAVTTDGDSAGFHDLVADAKDGYTWRRPPH